jgi:uncharacterized repeat protein (TIGR01451 family)
MLRIATAVAALAALLGPSVAARAGAPPAGSGAPLAKVIDCSVTTTARSATFYGRMDTMPGASRLAIRFVILERLGPDDVFTKVDLPTLRQWHASQAGVKHFGWKQTVDNLHLGAAYKARVQYRWLSPAGAVIAAETRETPVCRGPLPNIALGELGSLPGPTTDTTTYRIDVKNTGKTDADNVDVSLSVDKAMLDTVTVDHLAAGESRTISLTGPACQRQVQVIADPSNSIGERSEADNTQLFACP